MPSIAFAANSDGTGSRAAAPVSMTFACRRLLQWYREGVDVTWAVPLLSTYLGHVKVTDTYWYLTGIPALMAVAGERFERLAQPDGTAVAL
jgi:hypothetical protein